MRPWQTTIPLTAAGLALAALLHGCGGGGSTEDPNIPARRMAVNSPAAIAQVSADNYDDNVNGLVSGATLKRWMSNWAVERPAGITGKLVILQVSAGPAGAEYVRPDGSQVFTYLSPSSEWIQTRGNGVIETPSMVPDGGATDAVLRKYNIDPTRDMIVAAMGTGSTGNAMAQGRIWYALRYWGVDKTHLALLNGGNQWLVTDSLAAANFQATASTVPATPGTFTVKSLMVDNTQLQATARELLAVLPGADQNAKADGVFIWDARSVGQYTAGTQVERGEQGCASAYCAAPNPASYAWSFQNSGSRQGHPWGALQLQYTYMLDSTKGFSYKTKAVLASYLAGAVDASGIGFVDGTLATVGAGNGYQEGDTIYTYCETTFRAMITGVTAAVILGKPTRFYDGAMVEWNSLSAIPDNTGRSILPADSPWRTDLKSYFRAAMSSAQVAPRNVGNPYAANTDAIVNADKAYKTGENAGTGGGGNGLPPNPCGGG